MYTDEPLPCDADWQQYVEEEEWWAMQDSDEEWEEQWQSTIANHAGRQSTTTGIHAQKSMGTCTVQTALKKTLTTLRD